LVFDIKVKQNRRDQNEEERWCEELAVSDAGADDRHV
jgi:hypothetical protein